MFKNYYQILDVARDASPSDIKRSYRKLAKTHHPDSNPNDNSGKLFLLISEAYRVLSDESSRKSYNLRYDQIFRTKRRVQRVRVLSRNILTQDMRNLRIQNRNTKKQITTSLLMMIQTNL